MADRNIQSRTAVRRLAAARLISITGSEAAFIALLYQVYRRTGSSAWVSAALFLTFGTLAIVSPVAGMIGDRFDRRRVMIASDLAAAACFAGLAFASSPTMLLGLAFLAALTSAPFIAASDAGVPNLVGPGELAWTNGTISFGAGIGYLAGPALGGALVAAVGVPSVFLGNAVSFVLSAALVSTIDAPLSRGDRDAGGGNRELLAGFAFLLREPAIRRITAAFAVFTLSVGSIVVAELSLADSFGTGSVGYGLLATSFGLGALVGSLRARRLTEDTERQAIVLGSLVTAAAFGSVWMLPAFAPILVAMVVAGLSDGIVDVAVLGLIQRLTPDPIRSRVLAAVDGAILFTFAVSFTFAGALVDAFGPKVAYAIAGAGCLMTTAILAPLVRDGEPCARRFPVEG